MAVCSTVMPVLSAADLCAQGTHFGEISAIRFTRWGDDLTDWTDDTEWNTRLSNSTALATPPTLAAIRTLYCIGSVAAPERTEIRLPRRTKQYTAPKYSVQLRVYDTSDANMDAFRALPVGGQPFAVWLETEERMFGGNTGVFATLIGDPIIPESIDELMYLQLTVTFEGTFPEVQDNILA
ncbi:MAG: hypothetical protein OHK0019_00420 [Saprospiraceae bacterium]